MHNWEHYSRLPAYFLMATLVASCGGGGGDTLIGQSIDDIKVVSTVGTIVAPVDGALAVSVLATHDGAAVKQQAMTVKILSGDAAILLDGLSEPKTSVSIISDNNGNASFKLRGLAKNSVGEFEVSYTDANNNQTVKRFPYQVGDNLNTVFDFQIKPLDGSDNIVSTVGIDSVVKVVAVLKDKSNHPIVGQKIDLTTTIGQLATSSIVTDSAGQAIVELSGAGQSAGSGVVSATLLDAYGNKAANSMSLQIVNDYKLQLSTTQNNIPTGTSDVLLTAFVLDGTGTVVSGASDVKVRFEIVSGGGSLANVTAVKDGIATATYNLPKEAKNQNVQLRAIVSGTGVSTSTPPTDLIDLSLSGTKVAISSNKVNVSQGDTVELNLLLTNGKGIGIANQQLNLTASGLVLASPTVKTGADGSVKLLATVNTNGGNAASSTVSVSDSSLSVSNATVDLAVSQLSFDVTAPSTQPLPINTDQTITVNLKDGAPVHGRVVKVSTTLGVLNNDASKVVANVTIVDPTPTDSDYSGTATFTLNSTFPGESLIEASAQTAVGASSPFGLKTAKFVSFVSTIPNKLTIQAEKTTLSALEPTVLTAKVLDAKDNPVAGVDVVFQREKDPSNGALSNATVSTDKNGLAKVTYTAGSLTTAFNAVSVTASVPNAPVQLLSTQPLTVGGKALFVSIGTGGVIGTLKGNAENTTYALPHQVIVTDATGAPIANKDVTLSLVILGYYKGTYVRPAIGDTWAVSQYAACVNEDANQNGRLEPTENNLLGTNVFGDADVVDNGDGVLWPGSPVTLSAQTIRTDSNGVATFDVIYAKSYANWLSVKLIAATAVDGSESRADRTFATVALAADLKTNILPPGGMISPYGSVKTSDIQTQTDLSGNVYVVTNETGTPCKYRYYPAQ